MLDLEAVPEHIREWVETHLAPELSKADAYLQEHAASYQAFATAVLNALKMLSPHLGTEGLTVLSAVEKEVAAAEALYEKYFGTKAAGM